jgi:hypothetical protein
LFLSNIDKPTVFANKAALHRDRAADTFFKEINHDGKVYLQTWKRYYFTVPLNHGLARETGEK